MSPSQECPWCHLLSPVGTTRCDCGYNFSTGAVPGYRPPDPAPLWPRLLASLIDNAVTLGVTFLAFVVVFMVTEVPGKAREGLGTLLGLAVSFCYLVVAWGLWGSSIGKRMMSLRVVSAVTLEPPGIGLAAVRWVTLLFTQWISGFVIVTRKDRRGLHDLAAGTQVVEAWAVRVAKAQQ